MNENRTKTVENVKKNLFNLTALGDSTLWELGCETLFVVFPLLTSDDKNI